MGTSKQNEEGSPSRLNNCWHCSRFDVGGDRERPGSDEVTVFQESGFGHTLSAAVFDRQPRDDERQSTVSHQAFFDTLIVTLPSNKPWMELMIN